MKLAKSSYNFLAKIHFLCDSDIFVIIRQNPQSFGKICEFLWDFWNLMNVCSRVTGNYCYGWTMIEKKNWYWLIPLPPRFLQFFDRFALNSNSLIASKKADFCISTKNFHAWIHWFFMWVIEAICYFLLQFLTKINDPFS